MTLLKFFAGQGTTPSKAGLDSLPGPRREDETRPEYYDTDENLAAAVNVALLLGQPLLLTGEPGSGKTRLAFRVAWELKMGDPLVFETKSTSTARDLFYTFDALGRFHAAHCGEKEEAVEFMEYNALGRAILLANPLADVKHLLTEKARKKHNGPRRSVVLIDEIDKAPRDFPNDILNEIERMYFRIPELKDEVKAPENMSPIVIITSNSEKGLPDAFLRRCVFHDITFPEPPRMRKIMTDRLRAIPARTQGQTLEETVLNQAVDLFYRLRETEGIEKKPSTAELVAWLQVIREISGTRNPFEDKPKEVLKTLGTLVKKKEDFPEVQEKFTEWMNKTRP
jgi:MoxR-like ATPase